MVALFLTSSPRAHADTPRFWKGNLHTHTLWSDGDDYPEMVADWYKSNGYHFLSLSDHNIFADVERWFPLNPARGGQPALDRYLARFGQAWVESREGEKGREVRLKMFREFAPRLNEEGRFLMIPGEEITSKGIHINATNLQELVLPYTSADQKTSEGVVATLRRIFGTVLEQRKRTGVPILAHLNHPNFGWAVTAEEITPVEQERFFEVYNGHPTVWSEGDATHAGTERVWDIVNTRRLAELHLPVLYGIATDDAHHYHNEPRKNSRAGRGWVMVRAENLAAPALIEAMEKGEFYASSGVVLKQVERANGRIQIEVEAQPGVTYTTEFIGTRKGYDNASEPVADSSGTPLRVTRRYSAEVGGVLASISGPTASYVFRGDEIYVRARITSSRIKENPRLEGEVECAWVQPLVGAPR
jgi:histidinol phosphatase-like PHP family hydrolase